MLARLDDVVVTTPSGGGVRRGHQLVVVKSLLSSTAHHQAVFQHEAEMFARGGSLHPHVAGLVGVCTASQPALLVSQYCELVWLIYILRNILVVGNINNKRS